MEKLIVPAGVGYLDEVTDFVEALLEEQGCPMKTQLQIRLAVEEVFVNIASYAYPDGPGEAEVCCEILPDPARIRIRFTDSGIPFNPLAREDADTSEEGLMGREGGLGILLVKKTMDEVVYGRTEGKNILTMTKQI